MNDIMITNYFESIVCENQSKEHKLFYAIMHRRWNKVLKIISSDFNNCSWKDIKDIKFIDNLDDITIEYCFRFNLGFLKSIRNKTIYEQLCKMLGNDFKDLSGDTEIITYDDKRFCKKLKKSAIDIFWNGNQPVLDVVYFEKQTIPALQIMENGCSMVLDEVGTGKTVAGIYTIQQVIQDIINNRKENVDNVSILVVCPYNKREDWYSDILRQLGRKSIIIEQSDNGEIIFNKSGKRGIPQIYISGNIGGKYNDSSQQLKKSLMKFKERAWDLVIIDECHNCFENYNGIRANKVLLLTATPIVVSGEFVRTFNEYEDLLNKIMSGSYLDKKVKKIIDPIETQNYTKNNIFTCNFKEDIFNNIIIERQIEFVECERCKQRQEWFYKLRNEKDFFSAIFSDQDDNRLADKMKQTFNNAEYNVEENHKLNILNKILLGEENFKKYEKDSFLIFCETRGTVDMIFDKLSLSISDKIMIGKMYGDIAEIKNKSVNKDTIIPILKNNIRAEKRSVLITTGKSGGTGLNLGEFNTVIHYELPFTSNELEQRFGRIERADDLICFNDGDNLIISNKMIFLINKSEEGESDFIANRMLYYSISKINQTVKYMPIRNTVLFHPKYMKRIKNQANKRINEIIKFLDTYGTKGQLNEYFTYVLNCEKIKGIVKKVEQDRSLDLADAVKNLVNNIDQDKIPIEVRETVKNFYEKYIYNKNYEKLEKIGIQVIEAIEYSLWLEMTLNLWGISVDNQVIKEIKYLDAICEQNKTISEQSIHNQEYIENSNEDIENYEQEQKNISNKDDSEKLEITWKKVFNDLKLKDDSKRIDSIKSKFRNLLEAIENIEINGKYSGVFYIKNGEICNKKFKN